MYKIRTERPLNGVTLVILDTLQRTVEAFGAAHFLIGATARDILMTHVFGIESQRATLDVDFAIALENWTQFEAIKNALIRHGDFQPAVDNAHRLYFRAHEFEHAFPLDLIPFGPIEGPDNVIAWPPDMNVLMNVAGYAEALRTAITVEVGDKIIVNVVSIPALAAMKILAWHGRGLEDDRDAQDFYFLLKNYHRAGNETRLFDSAHTVLESTGFDLDLAGALLLGYDTNVVLEAATRDALFHVLRDPRRRDRLLIHMDRSLASNSSVTLRYLEEFERGFSLALPH